MSEWSMYGSERKSTFEKNLEPEELAHTLKRYQKVLGKDFGIQEVLKIEHIKGLALISEAINDAPEFLIDQIGKARSDSSFHSVADALENVAEAIREVER